MAFSILPGPMPAFGWGRKAARQVARARLSPSPMGSIFSRARELARSGSDFIGAFAAYAGWRGVRAGALVAASAVVDGAGTLLVLVPIINLVVEASSGHAGTGVVSRTLRSM